MHFSTEEGLEENIRLEFTMDKQQSNETSSFLPKFEDKLTYSKCQMNFQIDKKTTTHDKSRFGSLLCSFVFIFAACIIHFLSSGVSLAVGVYYLAFLDAFGQSNGLTAWVGSLNYGALCAAGPMASFLMKHFGCGTTVLIGGLLSSIGLLLSAYASNIYVVFATYGIIAGTGFGLVYTASLAVITYEFDRWRTFALGVSLSGCGIGTCIHPLLASLLITSYGWRGALIITSGLVLHICVMALLIRVASDSRKSENPGNNFRSTYKLSHIDISSSEECQKVLDSKISDKESYLSLAYVILHINTILYCFGQSVVFTHIVSYAVNKGHSLELCSSFISVIGVCGFLGRIILGALAQHPAFNVTILFSMCYVMSGCCCYGYCLWDNFVVMGAVMAFLGFVLAAFGPLLTEIVCTTVGIQHFASSYGYLMISMAAGTFLGAPSAGWLYDITNYYEYSFYLGGSAFVLSGIIMAVPKIFNRGWKNCPPLETELIVMA